MKAVILALCASIVLTACATPPRVENMIPTLNSSALTRTEKTLKVAEVTGGEKTNPLSFSSIENEGFGEALVKTLTSSGMFKRVSFTETGDYELHTDIISQKNLGVYSILATLFVNYRLVDANTGQELWKENVYSQYDATLGDAFSGQTRQKIAKEGVVRNNLAQLSKKLSEVLEKQK